jgi:hypothetical protein
VAFSQVSNDDLLAIRSDLDKQQQGKVYAWQIQKAVKEKFQYEMDVSTVRGRFCEMGKPLSQVLPGESGTTPDGLGKPKPMPKPEPALALRAVKDKPTFLVSDEMKQYVPKARNFDNYIERGIDKRLAIHYNTGKHPLTQGKQGTGKTFCHEFYAFTHGLPYFEYSCYSGMKLEKLFGDKTIENGSIIFRESLFTKAIQCASVILMDEVNAMENKDTFPYHGLLQSRKLFIKDADNGVGKWYELHDDCRIGFAQNPKSAKYIGGNVKPSNFLGRCTYITYPEFKASDIKKCIEKKFPELTKDDVVNFTKFYFACIQAIERGNIPVDISIRQLNSVIELWLAGLPLKEAIEDGLSSIMEAASQPKNKDAFWRLAQAVWKELTDEKAVDKLSSGFNSLIWRV